MPRPPRCRRICSEPLCKKFSPDAETAQEPVILTLDEFEVIRLVDLEKQTHEQCARQMEISRSTATEIYENAREKLADSIVNGHPLVIAGGAYRFCDGNPKWCYKQHCEKHTRSNIQMIVKGDYMMRIAVTYENGDIFQHFGHTEQFKFYDIADGNVVSAQVVSTNGSGHGALAGFLTANRVDILICGGIGGGAQMALAEAGIKLYGGVAGNADEAVAALLADALTYDPNVHCDHHDHSSTHACGDHGCGSHGCH